MIFWANKCVLYPVQSVSRLSFVSQNLAKLHQISFVKSTMKYIWYYRFLIYFSINLVKVREIWLRTKQKQLTFWNERSIDQRISLFVFIWNPKLHLLLWFYLASPMITFEVHLTHASMLIVCKLTCLCCADFCTSWAVKSNI